MSSKLSFLFLCLFMLVNFFLIISVGASSVVWNRTYGGANTDLVNTLIQTKDGGYALAGTSIVLTDNVPTDNNAWFIKTAPDGTIPEFPSFIVLPMFLTATFDVFIQKENS